MAREKKGRKSVAGGPSSPEPHPNPSAEPSTGPKNRFSAWDYVLVCIFFIAFCYIQKFVALKMLGVGETEGVSVERLSLNFFFDTLWKGFVIVTFLVWLHDFFYPDIEEEDTA